MKKENDNPLTFRDLRIFISGNLLVITYLMPVYFLANSVLKDIIGKDKFSSLEAFGVIGVVMFTIFLIFFSGYILILTWTGDATLYGYKNKGGKDGKKDKR